MFHIMNVWQTDIFIIHVLQTNISCFHNSCIVQIVFIIHVFLMDIIYIFHDSCLSNGLVHVFIIHVM